VGLFQDLPVIYSLKYFEYTMKKYKFPWNDLIKTLSSLEALLATYKEEIIK
jgi:hypothetical protein